MVCHGITEDGTDLTGLDINYSERVATITTISTPHRGSYTADVMLAFDTPDTLINAMAYIFGSLINDVADNPDVRATFTDLSEANASSFNANCPDDPDVRYFSYAGVSSILGINSQEDRERDICETSLRHPGTAARTDMLLDIIAAVVAHGLEARPNDGLVTVESAKWGKFLGCIPADHMLEVAAFGHDGFVNRTGFDINVFYRHHAFELSSLE